MTEHSEPPIENEGGGSLFFESDEDDSLFHQETIVQKAYKTAVMYQEIIDAETDVRKKQKIGDRLARKLTNACGHLDADIIVNGRVTRVGLNLPTTYATQQKRLETKEDWYADAVRARSLGYRAIRSGNAKDHTVSLLHIAETEPIRVISAREVGDVSQKFTLRMDPSRTGNAELLGEKLPVNERLLRHDIYGFGQEFMEQIDDAIEGKEKLQKQLRALAKLELEKDSAKKPAMRTLKNELGRYISEKIDLSSGSQYFIAGATEVYYDHDLAEDGLPYRVSLANGRHIAEIESFGFMTIARDEVIPVLNAHTKVENGAKYQFAYPLNGKLHVTKAPEINFRPQETED